MQATVVAQPDVPIVTAEWLKACQKEDCKVYSQQAALNRIACHNMPIVFMKVAFKWHQLKAFEGLEICISGYVKRKAQMGAFINQYGGHYNAELNKATCHVLVCEVPSGQKYK